MIIAAHTKADGYNPAKITLYWTNWIIFDTICYKSYLKIGDWVAEIFCAGG